MIQQIEITLPEFRRGYHLVTHHITNHLKELPDKGLVNIFIKHTSAAISINENADSTVRTDFESYMNRLVAEDYPYSHSFEGSDDMPAHLKSSIFGVSITVPVTNHHLNLGTWQGIYLCEFRNFGGRRNVVITIYS
jgi:secondary thiamine-phosphate synthase enzyme